MATDHHHGSHGDDGAGPLNHETTDISLEGIGKLTVGFVLVILVVSAAMVGTWRVLDRRARAADTSVSKINADREAVDVAGAPLMDPANSLDRQGRQPAGPKLLTNEPVWLREIRAKNTVAATTYGWVDKEAGVVRLPIERAKQLLVERGLPVTTPSADAAAPAPDAAAPGGATPPAAAATPPATP
jgi:hypothetical protein